MSSIKDNKQKVFSKIAAVKALNESPALKSINSLSSINNSGNEIDFLIDLFKVTGTFNDLMDVINKIIIDELSNIESDIKRELKNNIKSNLSCTIDPKIPSSLISDGFNAEIKNIDYYNIFFVDPETPSGNLIYTEPYDLTSRDFNTFLYYVIQSNTTQTWTNSLSSSDLIDVKFYETLLINNIFNIKINSEYTNKKISFFNNNFIDSIKLFENKDIISKVFNNITSNISSSTNKTISQLNLENQINDIINKMINSNDEIIDDSYFSFTSDELALQELESFRKSQGLTSLNQENETTIKVDDSVFNSSLTSITTNLNSNTTTYNEKSEAISNAVNNMSEQLSANNNSNSNDQSIKVNFIEKIIKNLSLVLCTTIISPKVILLYHINAILMGETPPNNPIDFMKQHKDLISSVVNSIKSKIVEIMLKKITKIITDLVNKEIKALVKEQINNRILSLKSLI